MRLRRRTRSRGQSVLEMACLLCLVAAVSIPALRMLSRTTKDTINAAIDYNSHSAVASGDPPGTPVYTYGEEPPEEPEGEGGDPPEWPVE